MKYTALIVAAGSGSRLGLGYNKAYYLLDERTILEHSMELFVQDQDCEEIVVVTDPAEYFRKVSRDTTGRIVFAAGGKTRQESVWNGLQAVISNTVLIHDGARPYLSKDCLEAIKKAMETEDAACLAVKCKDTVKLTEDGYFVQTLPREKLMAAQTPQAFRTELILTAMHRAFQARAELTDDCSAVEQFTDTKVRAVTGSYGNFKITTAEDLKGA